MKGLFNLIYKINNCENYRYTRREIIGVAYIVVGQRKFLSVFGSECSAKLIQSSEVLHLYFANNQDRSVLAGDTLRRYYQHPIS